MEFTFHVSATVIVAVLCTAIGRVVTGDAWWPRPVVVATVGASLVLVALAIDLARWLA